MSKRLREIVFFDVVPDLSSLDENGRAAVAHCVRAADWMTSIYPRQVSPDTTSLHEDLKRRTDAQSREALRYFEINAGPWDRFRGLEPFLAGIGPKPKWACFYPHGLTEGEWNEWLSAHPEDQQAFESNCTVITARNSRLVAIPYSEAYRDSLEEAAKELRSAARLLPAGRLREFLALRADALLSNNYWESELAWLETHGDPFEVTIGPYETYEDRFLGLKATFEAFIGLPDFESTRALQTLSGAVREFERLLADRVGYPSRGQVTSVEVVSDVYRGGEAAFGSQFVAYNLPNDKRLHQVKGSKNVLSRTMMEAKFSKLGRAVAERLLEPGDLELYELDKRMLFVLVHELAHGLGPRMTKRGEQAVGLEVALRDLHSPIEELKANTLGAELLGYLCEEGLVKLEDVAGCLVTEIVGIVQDWRTGYDEPHALASLIQYNWLRAALALRYDPIRSALTLNPEKALEGMKKLSQECLQIQLAGSYANAQAFVREWGVVAPEVRKLVQGLEDLPREVFAVFQVPGPALGSTGPRLSL